MKCVQIDTAVLSKTGWSIRSAIGRALIGLSCVSLMSASESVAAQGQGGPSANVAEVSVIVFPGATNWPLWVAQDEGFARRHGVSLNIIFTRNSVEQMTGLIDGKYNIAITAFDNVVAYREGLVADAGNKPAPVTAFMGGDSAFLSLVVRPEINQIADLRGKTLAVDSLTTGFAFALREILSKGGLNTQDYSFAKVGGVKLRFDGLLNGDSAGTLLLPPMDQLAVKKGFKRLAGVTDVVGDYQGTVGAARIDWAQQHSSVVVGYINAYRDALDWLYEPRNKPAALALLRRHIPDATEDDALTAYATLLDGRTGVEPAAKINPAGMETVLRLRKQFGPGPMQLDPPAYYYVSDYYDRSAKHRRPSAK